MCERQGLMFLKLFFPCPDKLESHPSPFNPLILYHSHTQKAHFSGSLDLLNAMEDFKIYLELQVQLAVVEVIPLCLRTVTFTSFDIY